MSIFRNGHGCPCSLFFQVQVESGKTRNRIPPSKQKSSVSFSCEEKPPLRGRRTLGENEAYFRKGQEELKQIEAHFRPLLQEVLDSMPGLDGSAPVRETQQAAPSQTEDTESESETVGTPGTNNLSGTRTAGTGTTQDEPDYRWVLLHWDSVFGLIHPGEDGAREGTTKEHFPTCGKNQTCVKHMQKNLEPRPVELQQPTVLNVLSLICRSARGRHRLDPVTDEYSRPASFFLRMPSPDSISGNRKFSRIILDGESDQPEQNHPVVPNTVNSATNQTTENIPDEIKEQPDPNRPEPCFSEAERRVHFTMKANHKTRNIPKEDRNKQGQTKQTMQTAASSEANGSFQKRLKSSSGETIQETESDKPDKNHLLATSEGTRVQQQRMSPGLPGTQRQADSCPEKSSTLMRTSVDNPQGGTLWEEAVQEVGCETVCEPKTGNNNGKA